MKAVLLLLAITVVSCAPKFTAAVPFVPKTTVKEAAEISPAISAVRETTSAADASGEVARSHVDLVKREATSLREGMQAALNEADRLRMQKSATEQDLENMWSSLQALTTRNLFLEAEVAKAAQSMSQEKVLRQAVSEGWAKIEALTREKEFEATALRLQLTDSENQRQSIHAVSNNNAAAVIKERSRGDRLAGEILIYRIAAWIAAALLILTLVFRIVVSRLKP